MNIAHFVNMSQNKANLEEAFKSLITQILGDVEWLRGWHLQDISLANDGGFDIKVSVPLAQGGEAALYIQCREELRSRTFIRLAETTHLPPGGPVVKVCVLALRSISPRLADLCAEHGWGWIDLAGNYQLDVPGVLHLRHTGNKPVERLPRPAANLSTPEAGRLMRVILAPENLGKHWTQRKIQLECDPPVSLGLVNKIARFMRDEAYVEDAPDKGVKVRDPMRLLFAWRDAYIFDRHERRGYFSLLQGRRLQDILSRFSRQADGLGALAAFSAADFQAPHVRQPKTWLYVHRRKLSLFEKLVDVKMVDSGENLVVLIPADEGVFYRLDQGSGNGNRMPATNLVQTYVDLVHCGGRGQEAAEALLEQRLKPAWKTRGIL